MQWHTKLMDRVLLPRRVTIRRIGCPKYILRSANRGQQAALHAVVLEELTSFKRTFRVARLVDEVLDASYTWCCSSSHLKTGNDHIWWVYELPSPFMHTIGQLKG